LPRMFCQFSLLLIKLQFLYCMQNDRMIKAKLFCKKLLSIQNVYQSELSTASGSVVLDGPIN
jgi:hypothetical protein